MPEAPKDLCEWDVSNNLWGGVKISSQLLQLFQGYSIQKRLCAIDLDHNGALKLCMDAYEGKNDNTLVLMDSQKNINHDIYMQWLTVMY